MKKLLMTLALLLALLSTAALAEEISIADISARVGSGDLSCLERYNSSLDDMTYSGLFYTDDTRFAYAEYERAERWYPLYAQLGFEVEARDGEVSIYPVLLLPRDQKVCCAFKAGNFRCAIDNRMEVEKNGKTYKGLETYCDSQYDNLDCEETNLDALRMSDQMVSLLYAISSNNACVSRNDGYGVYELPAESIAAIQAYLADLRAIDAGVLDELAYPWFTLYTTEWY